MGIFGSIANAAQRAKDDARRAAETTISEMNRGDMYNASRVLLRDFERTSSIMQRNYMLQGFQRKLKETTDLDDIYHAFEEMYILYKRSGKSRAMNIAQILGKRLHQKDDYRVEELDSDDRRIYVPRDRSYY